jgi:hypothetical protein
MASRTVRSLLFELQLFNQAFPQAKEESGWDLLPLGLLEQQQNFWKNHMLT